MDLSKLNYVAIVVAAVSAFVVGGVWYSPLLFVRVWMKETGLEYEALRKRNMVVVYGASFVLLLIIAFNLAAFLAGPPNLAWGLTAGALAGVGWVTTAMGVTYLFEARIVSAVPGECRLSRIDIHAHGRDSGRLEIAEVCRRRTLCRRVSSVRVDISVATGRPAGRDSGAHARHSMGARPLLCRRHGPELEALIHRSCRTLIGDYNMSDCGSVVVGESPPSEQIEKSREPCGPSIVIT